MVQLALLQLILYNFLENHLKWVILLNCWDLKTQLMLPELLMDHDIYAQLWSINHLNLDEEIEGQYLTTNNPQVGLYFDFNCNESSNVLTQISEEKLFKQQFHWLIYDEQANFSKFHDHFQNFHMAVDADVSYAFPNPKCVNSWDNSSFITYDVYNNGYYLGGELNMTADQEILCSQEKCFLTQYLSCLHEKMKYENRWTLRDITMRVTTVTTTMPQNETDEAKINHLMSMENMNIDALARYGFSYLMILKDTLECNFFYNFTNIWSCNETSCGAIGALGIDNAVDLASTAILSTKARFVYITPTMSLGKFRQVCLFRTPRNSGIQGEVFLKPFSPKVWICFGVVLSLIAVALWFTFVVESRQLKLYIDAIPSLLNTWLISFGSACCQGSSIVPSSRGGRMTFICLFVLTFIIYNYYTSIVVAILLGSPVKSDIKTIDQLAESNLEVALEPMSYTRTYLNFSTLPGIRSFVRNKIQTKKNPNSIWLPVEEGLRRVRDEPGFVYGTEAFSGYSLVENSFTAQEICDINEVLLRPEQPLFTHLHKNSSYREMIKIKQIRILETGIHRRLEQMWVKSRLSCYLSSSYVMQVGLEYTAPLFIMLAGVFVLAIILLALEIQWRKYSNGGDGEIYRLHKGR